MLLFLPLLLQSALAYSTNNGTCKVSANQIHKNPRPVAYPSANKPYEAMSDGEWKDRVELAALARVLYLYGFGADLAAQCVMARLRDQPDTMLMNEWGLFFEETTASSPVKAQPSAAAARRGSPLAAASCGVTERYPAQAPQAW